MNMCLSNKYNKYIPSRNTQSLFKIEVMANKLHILIMNNQILMDL